MKLTSLLLCLSAVPAFATVFTVGNGRGPVATQEVTDNTGALVAGFAAFGILDEAGIAGAATTFEGLSFNILGSNEGPVSTSTTGQFALSTTPANINPEGTPFADQNVYLVVGFGGSDLSSSSELFIHRFEGTFVEQPTPINLILSSAPGDTLLGTEGGNRFAAALITPIPEPSSALLAGLALVGGLVRRRR